MVKKVALDFIYKSLYYLFSVKTRSRIKSALSVVFVTGTYY